MKVLHIIGGGDTGGAKTHVLTLVKELEKHINIKIISLRPGIFSDEAREMGIDVEVIKSGNIFSDMKNVISIIRNGGFQIIHSHGAKANLFAIASKYFAKIPIITTVHSDYKLDYLESVPKMLSFGILNTIALRFFDYYVAVSGNFKRMLVNRKFNSDRIFTVYNGMDFSRPLKSYSRSTFAEKYKLNINDNDIVVGILVRLDPVKGLDSFVKAADIVLKTNPQVKFILGGEGKERKALENRIKSLGIADHVFLPGWIDDPFEFMSCIDINVLTSLSESFPYVILEGTFFKKATVSSDVGGISDLIEDGATGFLFKPGDYMTLAQHLVLLANSPDLRFKIGQQIYEKASTQFSLENMCQTQLEIYRNILSRS
jgi:glycosyltransferase involved in cell wall biosynthesis